MKILHRSSDLLVIQQQENLPTVLLFVIGTSILGFNIASTKFNYSIHLLCMVFIVSLCVVISILITTVTTCTINKSLNTLILIEKAGLIVKNSYTP